jgi:hypothetical protein
MSTILTGAHAALGVLLLLLLSSFPRPAAACSVCLPGDPLFSTHGASAQEVGTFSIYLETRSFRKTSGILPHDDGDETPPHGEEAHDHGSEEGHAEAHAHEAEPHEGADHEDGEERFRGQRLDLYASWTPLDRFTVTLDVPFAWNRIVEDEGGESTRSTLSGFGDVSLGTSFVLWRNRDVLPSTWIEGRLWLKTPTGRDETKVDGRRDPHLQPGTGSWDFGAGLAAVHRLSWGALYGSVFYRENTEGSLDYEYGDVILASAALEVPVGHALSLPALDWLTAGLELNFRYASYDFQDGERFRDSGGAILYAAPSLRVRLPFGVRESPASLRASVQLPLAQTWLHNQQREEEIWSVGLLIPF